MLTSSKSQASSDNTVMKWHFKAELNCISKRNSMYIKVLLLMIRSESIHDNADTALTT